MAVLPRLPVSTSRRLHAGAAVSPSRRGAIAVDIELTQFNAALERYLQVVPQDVGTAVETLAFDLEGRVKLRSAVDTGRLRASIHTRLPGTRSGYTYRDTQGRSFDGTLDTAPASPLTGVIEAVVGTNVGYAPVIEANGGKATAPGMWRVSIAEMRGELDRAVERVLTREGQE